MKTLILAAAALIGTGTLAAAPAQAQVNGRQWNQQHRIYEGARQPQHLSPEARLAGASGIRLSLSSLIPGADPRR